MIHPKYESDVASVEASSSSPASSKRAAYFVQSPSCDSQSDHDKSSVHATPIDSPTYPSYPSSFDRISRSSSGSRLSGNWRWVLRGNRRRSGKGWQDWRRSGKGWQDCNVIDEEADYDNGYDEGYSMRFKCFLAVLALGAIFGLFCVVIWGASRPYKPHINIKSLEIHNFYYGQGADHTGVPTEFITLNSSVHMTIYNPATFFGIQIDADPVNLIYLELPVATGQLNKCYQPRKSERILTVNLGGDRVPLYGAGKSFGVAEGSGRIPMKLEFKLQSQGYVIGKLVKSKYEIPIFCTLIVDFRSSKELEFKGDSCAFD